MGRREPRRGSPELSGGRSRAAAPADPAPEDGPAGGGGRTALGTAARHWAEELAERSLEAKGYAVLTRNYRLRGGELDLVCRAPDGTVVFVEVRQRATGSHGGADGSLTAAKLRRVRKAAARYLAVELGRPDERVRFDAVLVLGPPGRARLSHLEDAF